MSRHCPDGVYYYTAIIAVEPDTTYTQTERLPTFSFHLSIVGQAYIQLPSRTYSCQTLRLRHSRMIDGCAALHDMITLTLAQVHACTPDPLTRGLIHEPLNIHACPISAALLLKGGRSTEREHQCQSCRRIFRVYTCVAACVCTYVRVGVRACECRVTAFVCVCMPYICV
jgi:hypothetical protein